MAKNSLAAVVQEGLPVLAGIREIKTTWSADDASSLLADGAVLLAVAKAGDKAGHGPFRYALGWPKSAGVPPRSWTQYDGSAGEV